MLKEVLLINSANFDFARVNLEKDLFFLGDNGSGKTSFIRAIHYLYSGDVRSVGIPNDKEGFKEYYFAYENSYIIYVFEEFFIFVYKRANELIKYFSKQKFELEKILNESGELLEFKEIRSYIKSAFHTRTEGVEDFTSILYAQNKNYLDFSIASIANKDIFLRLYHSVFNIDKAIIDAKSIKKALFTSLNLSSQTAFFDPDSYLVKINAFMHDVKLYKAIEQQSDNILKAKQLYQNLLKEEEELLKLSGEILFAKQKEEQEQTKLQEKFLELQVQTSATQTAITLHKKVLKRFEKRVKQHLYKLESQLHFIEELQKKFTQKNIEQNKELLLEESTTLSELQQLQKEHLKLTSGLEDKLKSVQNEIASLKQKIELTLPQHYKQLQNEKFETLHTQLEQKREQLEFAYETIFKDLEQQEKEILNQVEQTNKTIATLLEQKAKEYELFTTKQKQLQKEYALKQQTLQEQKNQLAQDIFTNKQAINEQTLTFEQKMQTFAQLQEQLTKEFEEQKSELQTQIGFVDAILYPKEGSFKEFLDNEIEDWEKKLYPILDDSLLEKDAKTLQLKKTSNEVLGFSFEVAELKTIPTKDEAKAQKERLAQKQTALYESFTQSVEALELEQQTLQTSHQQSVAILEKKIESFTKELALRERDLQNLSQELEQQTKELELQLQKVLEQKEQQLNKQKEQLHTLQNKLKNLKTQNQQQTQKKKKELEAFVAQQQNQKQEIQQTLQNELQKEQDKLKEEMQHLELTKNSITKDQRILTLQKQIELLEKKREAILGAKLFLEEYNKVKQQMQNYLPLQKEKEKLHLFVEQFNQRIEQKIAQKEQNLQKLFEKQSKIQQQQKVIVEALEIFEQLTLYNATPIKSETSLYELTAHFRKIENSRIANRAMLLRALQKIAQIKGLHKLDNIFFDFTLFEKEEFVTNLSSIKANIENIYEVKEFKLSTFKQALSLDFRNFVEGIYTKKLELFSNTEEQFISLVKKINKELKGVDFGVISDISIETSMSQQDSIAKILLELKEQMLEISALFVQDSLFFEQKNSLQKLQDLEELFLKIKKELKSDKISLIDTIDLSLSFRENGKKRTQITQLKNESSTGGSMLLKIALAISILKVYLKQSQSVFFLIVDEVSRLHSSNQKRLKEFANQSGFKIIFVTPEPVFANADELKYYKFVKMAEDKFEAIELNR